MNVRLFFIIILLLLFNGQTFAQTDYQMISKKDLELFVRNGWQLFSGRDNERISDFYITNRNTYILKKLTSDKSIIEVYDRQNLLVEDKEVKIDQRKQYEGIPAFYGGNEQVHFGQFNNKFIDISVNGKKAKFKTQAISAKEFKSQITSSQELNFFPGKVLAYETFDYNKKKRNKRSILLLRAGSRTDTLAKSLETTAVATISKFNTNFSFAFSDNVLIALNAVNSSLIFFDGKTSVDTMMIVNHLEKPPAKNFLGFNMIRLVKDETTGYLYLVVAGKESTIYRLSLTDSGKFSRLTKIKETPYSLISARINDGFIYGLFYVPELNADFIYRTSLAIK